METGTLCFMHIRGNFKTGYMPLPRCSTFKVARKDFNSMQNPDCHGNQKETL